MTDETQLKILIADDEPLAAERLQMLLARIEGVHLVGTAHDGESAVRMAEALEPNLVLLDIAQDPVGDWMLQRVAPFYARD